jgi:hypothetical protein
MIRSGTLREDERHITEWPRTLVYFSAERLSEAEASVDQPRQMKMTIQIIVSFRLPV